MKGENMEDEKDGKQEDKQNEKQNEVESLGGSQANLWLIAKTDETCLLKVTVRAGARKSCFDGTFGDPLRLKVKVHAAPSEGKANKELIKFLSRSFGLKQVDLEIIRGMTSSSKDIVIRINAKNLTKILDNKFL
jgi:uncharacterized protein (TIGR00251 family)